MTDPHATGSRAATDRYNKLRESAPTRSEVGIREWAINADTVLTQLARCGWTVKEPTDEPA